MSKNYNEKLSNLDSQIKEVQTDLSQTTDLKEVSVLTKKLNNLISKRNNIIQLEASKEALKSVSLKELRNIENSKEALKEFGITKKIIREFIQIKELEAKQQILKEFKVLKEIQTNLNGKLQTTGYIIEKNNKIALLSFDFLHIIYDKDNFKLSINNTHKLVGSKTNLQHCKHFLDYLLTVLNDFKGSDLKVKELSYGQPLNYLNHMTIDNKKGIIKFNVNENSFYENPVL